MYKNQVWYALLTTIFLAAIWYSIDSGYSLYQYSTKSSTAPPQNIQWSVKAKASDYYIIVADYSYKVQGKPIEGRSVFDAKGFKNIPAANHAIEVFSKKKWTVWFSPKNPQNSTINRFFPLKSCIYTAILWAILFYFFWLGIYIKKFEKGS